MYAKNANIFKIQILRLVLYISLEPLETLVFGTLAIQITLIIQTLIR